MDKHFCPYCMTPVPEGESCSVCGLTAGTYKPSPHHLPPGTVLMDRYLVGRVLGEGGFGITYIGCDLRLEMKVAIKEYYPVDRATRNAAVSTDVTSFMGAASKSYERGKQKFLDEALIMARMEKQQAIVSVRDFFEANNTVYIVMEYVEGITLKELVARKGGRIAPEELFPMVEPLFKALSVLHETGLIHRDISPDNLMLEDGKIRLLDFGCAREASGGSETLTIALKHGYAPMEQYQQKGQGPWTDIYALCATLYYCLVGNAPPPALDRIGEDTLLLPTKLGVRLTEEEERALLKGLRIQPSRRFQSAAELHAALYGPESPPPPPPPVPDPDPPKTIIDGLTVDVKNGEVHHGPEPVPPEPVPPEPVPPEPVPPEPVPPEPVPPEPVPPEPVPPEPVPPEPVPSEPGRKKLFLGYAIALALFLLCVGLGIWQASLAGGPKMSEVLQGNVFVLDYSPGHEPKDLQKAFDDADIATVLIPSQISVGSETNTLTVTKPLRIEQGASLGCNNVVVTGDGQIEVEGSFNTAYLRLEGDTVFHASTAAQITLDGPIVWVDRDEQLQIDDPVESAAVRRSANYLVLDGQGRDAVSVTSAEELVQLLNEGSQPDRMISVDADISLNGNYGLSRPLRISEGASLNISGSLNMGEEGAVLNYGLLTGDNLYSDQSRPLVNLGQIGSQEDPLQFWLEGSCVINEGEAWFDYYSRLWMGGRFLNLEGTVYADNLIMANSTMENFGTLQTLSGCDGFMIAQGGWLNNYGMVAVQSDSQLQNYGYIENFGQIVLGANSRFFNCWLENQGRLIMSDECQIDQLGAVYGPGETVNMDDLPYMYVNGMVEPVDAVTVSTEEELFRELELGSGDILLSGRVTAQLRKNYELKEGRTLFIAGELVLDGPGDLIVTGGRIYLLGDWAADNGWWDETANLIFNTGLTLRENAEIRMEGGTRLGGSSTLTLDRSVFWGWDTILETGGATIQMQDHALFVPSGIHSVQGGTNFNVTSGSVLVIPGMMEEGFYRSNFTVEDPESLLICLGSFAMSECPLDIQGRFLTCGWDLRLEDCQVNIGQEGSDSGSFALVNSNLTIRGDSHVTNWGSVGLGAWDEFSLYLSYDDPEGLVNYGNIDISMRSNVENNAGIRNEGYLHINARQGFDMSRITGSGQVDFS